MKNYLILFLLTVSNLIFCQQQNNPCDSLKKNHNVKKNVTKSVNQKNDGITITIDNSYSSEDCDSRQTKKEEHCTPRAEKKLPVDDKSNDFNWNELYKNLITIFLGLVAGFIALYQMKSNIISSARIRWIEDLRDSLSKFYPVCLDVIIWHSNFMHAKKTGTQEVIDSNYAEYDRHQTTFNALSNKIKMQLNSKEDEHRKIEEIIDLIDSKITTENIQETDQLEVELLLKEIVILSKKIFKKEWDKSKKLFKI